MTYRNLAMATAALVALSSLLINCSSTPEAADEPLVEHFDTAPTTAGEAFESASVWLDGDSVLVTAAAQPGLWDLGEMAPIFLDTAQLEEGQPGTNEALQDDISAAIIEDVGFDPAHAEAFAVGYSGSEFTAVVFGDFGDFSQLSPVELEDQKFTVYDLDYRAPMRSLESSEFYLKPIDAPRPGFVVATSTDLLTQMASGEDSLAATGGLENYATFFENTEATFAAGALLDEFLDGEDGVDGHPDTLGMRYGSRVELLAEGDTQHLNEFQSSIDDAISEIREDTQRASEDSTYPVTDQIAALVGFHIASSAEQRLSSTLDGDRLHYEFELLDVDEDSIYTSPAIPTLTTLIILEELDGHFSHVEQPVHPTPPEGSAPSTESSSHP